MTDRIVKGGVGRGGKPVQFDDFEAAGRRIIAQAEHTAKQLVAQAQAEADQVRAQAVEQAVEEGRQAGIAQVRAEMAEQAHAEALQAAQQELAPVLELMRELAAQFHQTVARYQSTAHDELLKLALDVARKVVGREIRLDPELVARTVRRAVDMVLDKHKLTIHVHPQDRELLEQAFPEVEAVLGQTGWTLSSDEGLQRGGALVRTEAGDVDARIETQLAEIERALCGSRQEEAEGEAPAEPEGEA